MRHILTAFFCGAVNCCAMNYSTVFATLPLNLLQTTDISSLGFESVGGLDFDDATGRIWLSDASGTTNDVASIDPLTGNLFSSFDASVVPGLSVGPDALALQPGTGDLFLFSTFLEDEAGSVTQSGVLINDFGSNTNINAGGASFRNATDLYVVDESNGDLKTLDLLTGNVMTTQSLTNFTDRLGASGFNPGTGLLVAYSTNTRELLEIDVDSATVVSQTSVASFLSNPSFPSGLAFNADGSRLFLASGNGTGADELLVFDVVPEPATCALAVVGLVCLATRVRRLKS